MVGHPGSAQGLRAIVVVPESVEPVDQSGQQVAVEVGERLVVVVQVGPPAQPVGDMRAIQGRYCVVHLVGDDPRSEAFAPESDDDTDCASAFVDAGLRDADDVRFKGVAVVALRRGDHLITGVVDDDPDGLSVAGDAGRNGYRPRCHVTPPDSRKPRAWRG